MDGSVLVAFLIQTVGYGALLAVYPHSSLPPIVDMFQRVPVPLLVLFAISGLPAVVLASVVGAVLALVGPSPGSIPMVLFARGDVFVFGSAYGLSVAGIWICRRRWRDRGP